MNILEKAWQGFKDGRLTSMVFPTSGSSYGGWGATSDGWGSRGYGGGWGSLASGQRLDYAALVGDPSQSSVVMSLCNWAGRNYPAAPLQAVRRTSDGAETVLHDDPCIALMDRPNPVYGGALMWAALIADCMLSGQGYLLKRRAAVGSFPVELWWVPSPLLRPVWPQDGSAWIDHYVYTPTTTPIRVEVADVVHLRPFGLDPANPRLGRAPLAALYAEIWTDQEAQAYTGSILRNLAVPGVVISPKSPEQRVTADDAERAKVAFEQKFGSDNRGRAFVAQGPMDVTPLSFNPQQMDLATLRRLPEERVTAVFGIPAVVAGLGAGLDHNIYNNVEQARESAFEEFLIPIQRINAHDLATQLLPDFTTDPRIRLQHDYSHVRALQEDQDEVMKRAVSGYLGGVLMRYDARQLVNLPVEDSDKIYFLPRSSGLLPEGELLLPGAPEAAPYTDPAALDAPPATPPALPPGKKPPALPPGKGQEAGATITDADLAAAVAYWQAAVGAEVPLAGLLDATVSPNGNGVSH